MVQFISYILPYKVLASHILLVVLFLAVLARGSWGRGVTDSLGKYALVLGFLVALSAVLGSLFYSDIVGYEPCTLCWWLRVLIFPQLVLLMVAWRNKDRGVFKYVFWLSLLAAILALYYSYTQLGGESILPCTAEGAACSKVYFRAFGYITIPLMSLTIALYLLLLSWVNKLYENRNA